MTVVTGCGVYDGGREVGVGAREGRSSGATASPRPNRASHRLKRERSAGSCSAAKVSTRTSGVTPVGWADSFGAGVCDMSAPDACASNLSNVTNPTSAMYDANNPVSRALLELEPEIPDQRIFGPH